MKIFHTAFSKHFSQQIEWKIKTISKLKVSEIWTKKLVRSFINWRDFELIGAGMPKWFWQSNMYIMAKPVVEFSMKGYNIRKIFS